MDNVELSQSISNDWLVSRLRRKCPCPIGSPQSFHLSLLFSFSFRNTARLTVGLSCRNAAKCCFLSSKIVNTSQGHNKTPTITCGNVLTVTFLSKPNRLDCLSFMYAIIVPMKIQTNTIFAITISINKSKLGIALFYRQNQRGVLRIRWIWLLDLVIIYGQCEGWSNLTVLSF